MRGTINISQFTNDIDFITTPGFLQGGTSREDSGLPKDTGPYRLITDIGVYGYHSETKEMTLLNLHPGKSVDDVKENSGFDILLSDDIAPTIEPTDEELRVLREEVDPQKVIIGRG